jgi:hypothetical protein
MKTMADPEFLAEAKKRAWEVTPANAESLAAQAKKVTSQAPEVIERMKKSWANNQTISCRRQKN